MNQDEKATALRSFVISKDILEDTMYGGDEFPKQELFIEIAAGFRRMATIMEAASTCNPGGCDCHCDYFIPGSGTIPGDDGSHDEFCLKPKAEEAEACDDCLGPDGIGVKFTTTS